MSTTAILRTGIVFLNADDPPITVTPAKAGVQFGARRPFLDAGFHRHDGRERVDYDRCLYTSTLSDTVRRSGGGLTAFDISPAPWNATCIRAVGRTARKALSTSASGRK